MHIKKTIRIFYSIKKLGEKTLNIYSNNVNFILSNAAYVKKTLIKHFILIILLHLNYI